MVDAADVCVCVDGWWRGAGGEAGVCVCLCECMYVCIHRVGGGGWWFEDGVNSADF